MELVIFVLVAGMTLTGAILMVTLRNIVRSVLAMIMAFVGIAGVYLVLEAEFLAAIQVLVYVGAVAVLVLFAIMLTQRVADPSRPANNNQAWLAVRQSTLDVFPDGHAAKANVMALTELKPSPDYEKVVETCGGRGEKVEGPGELVAALRRALESVHAGTPVALNVQTQARR